MLDTLEVLHRRAIADYPSTLHWYIAGYWNVDRLGPTPDLNDVNGTVRTYVDRGQWVIHCPAEGCTGAMIASDTDHLFVCIACGLRPAAVEWPAERDAIEAALAPRPRMNQHWLWDEPVTDLEAETAAWLASKYMAGVV